MSMPLQPDQIALRSPTVAPTNIDARSDASTAFNQSSSSHNSVTVSRQSLQDLVRYISYPTDVDLSTEANANTALRAAYLQLLHDTDDMISKAAVIDSSARGAGFRPRFRPSTDRELGSMTPEQAGRFKLKEGQTMDRARTSVERLEADDKLLAQLLVQSCLSSIETSDRVRELESSYWYKASSLASETYDVLSWIVTNPVLVVKQMVSEVLGIDWGLRDGYDTDASEKGANDEMDAKDGDGTASPKEEINAMAPSVAH